MEFDTNRITKQHATVSTQLLIQRNSYETMSLHRFYYFSLSLSLFLPTYKQLV